VQSIPNDSYCPLVSLRWPQAGMCQLTSSSSMQLFFSSLLVAMSTIVAAYYSIVSSAEKSTNRSRMMKNSVTLTSLVKLNILDLVCCILSIKYSILFFNETQYPWLWMLYFVNKVFYFIFQRWNHMSSCSLKNFRISYENLSLLGFLKGKWEKFISNRKCAFKLLIKNQYACVIVSNSMV